MKKKKSALLLLILTVLVLPLLGAKKKLLGEGEGFFRPVAVDSLLAAPFAQELSEGERAYLGLKEAGPFTLADVGADLLVLEFLNVYCYACVQQAPIMNRVHRAVEGREDLRDRVRFFGIAVGNGPKETAEFRSQFDIPYAVVPDPDFASIDAVGNPGGTPFTILLPLAADGSAPGARAHLGLMRDVDRFVEEIAATLAPGPAAGAPEAYHLTEWRNLSPDLSAVELEEKVRASAAAAGLSVRDVAAVDVEGEKNVYRLTLDGGEKVWAKVAGRAKVCNVCHDIFFILLFDSGGKVLNFTPILVTKYENELITDDEAAFLRGRVTGRSITEPVVFDAEVDAISQATMSSELIFDTMRRLGDSFREFGE